MSTYLSGSPTFLPTVQPYEPNFQLYAGALQMKQTQYDQNRKKISDLYGSLLNSPMSRDSNIQARDEFFNTIDYEIKKLSGVDLSLEQNVDSASSLFNSLYENKNIVKDMMWTKNYNNEMDRAEGFRNCIDAEKCGGAYWEGGVQGLQWKREEFRKVGDDQAMGFGDVRYTPYVNVQEKAQKLIKDLGWSMSTPSISADGKWMVQTKNGEQLQGPLLAHFQKIMGQDPAIGEYYKTKAYVERKNAVAGGIETYGSEEASESAYIAEKNDMITKYMARVNGESKYAKDQTNKKVEDAQQNIKDGKVLRSQEVDDEISRLMGESDNYAHTENETGKAMSSVTSAMSSNNSALKGEALDNALAMLGLNDDLSAAAQILAYQNYEVTMKENPWAMAEQNHRWRMEEAAAASKAKDEEAQAELIGNEYLNTINQGQSNQYGADLDPDAAYKQFRSDQATDVKALHTATHDVLTKTLEAAQTLAKAGGTNSAQAADDARSIVGSLIKQYKTNADFSGKHVEESNKFIKMWNGMSPEEQAGYAKNLNTSYLISKFDGISLNSVTKKTAVTMYENNSFNKTNRSYLRGMKAELDAKIGEADKYEVQVSAWKDVEKQVTQRILSKLETTGELAGTGMYAELIDPNTHKLRSSESFAYAMARKNSHGLGTEQERLAHYKKDPNIVQERSKIRGEAINRWMSNPALQKTISKEKYIDQTFLSEMPNQKPSVQIRVGEGKYKSVPVEQFFTKNGHVNSKYEIWADKWKPTDRTDTFWLEYNNAKTKYAGETYEDSDQAPGFWDKAASFIMNPNDPAGAAMSIGKKELEGFKEWEENIAKGYSSVINEFKAEFANSNLYDHTIVEGMYGKGSVASDGLWFNVDYSAPLSQSVINEQSFLNDAFGNMQGKDVLFSFGGPGATLPENNKDAFAFTQRLLIDAITTKKGTAGRPVWTGDYNTIAGGKPGWQSYTINMNDPAFMKQYIGTETAPGPYYDLLKDQKGAGYGQVTIYLNDKVAKNNLHQQTKLTSLDRRLNWAGSAPIGSGQFGDFTNLTMNKINGGYNVNGNIAVQRDPNGAYTFESVNQDYMGDDVDPNSIESLWHPVLEDIGSRLGEPPVVKSYK